MKKPGKMNNRSWIESSMMMTLVSFMICVQVICSWSSSVEAQPTTIRPTAAPCSRLMMKGIDDDELPWKQMAGIYHLTNFTADLFPVYKHESIDMYFYYNRSMKEFRFGEPYQNTSILLGAFTNGRIDQIGYYSKPFSPFYYMITGWYQYNPISQQYVALSGAKQRIDPTCIVDHVVTCSSGMVEFDDNLKQINPSTRVVTNFHILGLDYYKQYPGVYLNERPIYTRMRGDTDTQTYLFYKGGNWLIGGVLNSYSWNADVRTKSSAMRPEHVLGKWEFNTNGEFTSIETKLRCRALTVEKACDTSPASQCLNGGTCLTSSDGVTKYCGCTPGYRGLYCEDPVPSCPRPTELINQLDTIEGIHPYFVASLFEGSVLTIFRSLGLRPSYWFSTCDGSGWPNTTITILQPTTTTLTTRTTSRSSTSRGRPTTIPVYIIPTRTTTRTTTTDYWSYTTPRRFVLEWNDSNAAIALAVMLIVMQFLNPAIIWLVIRCVSISRTSKVELEEDVHLQNLSKTYQTSLETFRQNHPQPEDEYDAITSGQLSSIHEDYRRQSSEIAERKMVRKSKAEINAKWDRVYSLYAYCTLWIFLLYVILFATTRLFGGMVFLVLCIVASALVFTCHFIVLVEYKSSSERQYIGNLSSSVFAVERVEAIRATQPVIYLRAECYHFETKTRTVSYTDTNGNLQTRMEVYQEKVVTNLFIEPVIFQYWRDTSPPQLVGINNKGLTKIKMTLSVEPGDEETRADFDSRYQAFHDAYEHMDVNVDFSMEKQVQGFEKRLAAYTDNREKPFWVSNALFTVASILFLSWPYRWAFNSITSRTEFAVSKLVYLNQPEEEDNRLSDGNNCCPAVGDVDSGAGGKHLEADSTAAVTIDNDEITRPMTIDVNYVNHTFNAYCS